jgi:hypothetical protein
VTFDRNPVTRQNGFVRRLILLAIGLSALLWTASARTAVAPSDIVTMLEAGSCLLAADSHGPSDQDQQWTALHHTIAAVTESMWKSAPVHAALAATRATCVSNPAHTVSSADPPVRSAPQYLRHTPLLI